MTRQKITSRGEGQCQQGNREPENQQTSKPEVPRQLLTHFIGSAFAIVRAVYCPSLSRWEFLVTPSTDLDPLWGLFFNYPSHCTFVSWVFRYLGIPRDTHHLGTGCRTTGWRVLVAAFRKTKSEIGSPLTQRCPFKCEIKINWFNLRASPACISYFHIQLYSDFDFSDDESKQKENSEKNQLSGHSQFGLKSKSSRSRRRAAAKPASWVTD